ncbi:phosphate butyryltransferase [Lachnospiraceae bacterium PM6-15]|uniref:phosphate acyltransferase n=1 Tax=Ohessyouella blattaphilus TaxID=2949333 RepID=UPI003E285975
MLRNFEEILAKIEKDPVKKRIVVVAAHDEEVLGSVVEAYKKGIAVFTLIGKSEEIAIIMKELGEDATRWDIIDEPDDKEAARLAMKMIADGAADLPMKGLLHTAVFLKAVFNKEYGLVPENALVGQITVAEYKAAGKLIMVTDCAVTVDPGYAQKVQLIQNAVKLAKALGYETPKVAVITPVEVVNPKMPETVEASMLTVASMRNQIKGCIVDGPLALDNALSKEAAVAKGIDSPVAGDADILLMPNLSTGNVLDKALRYFAEIKTGSAVVGGKIPFIITSRSDTAQNKLHAIALSVL